MTDRYPANENFPTAIVRTLRAAGNDVLYAAETLIAAPDEQVRRLIRTASYSRSIRISANWCFIIGSRLLRASFCSAWAGCRRKGYSPL